MDGFLRATEKVWSREAANRIGTCRFCEKTVDIPILPVCDAINLRKIQTSLGEGHTLLKTSQRFWDLFVIRGQRGSAIGIRLSPIQREISGLLTIKICYFSLHNFN